MEIRWSEEDVVDAEKMFADLREKGYRAFKMTKSGDKGDQVDEFDPEASAYLMLPPIRGG